MGSFELVEEDADGGTRADERRRHRRSRIFKSAQIAFGGSVLDCVLLNASPYGAQACLRAFAEVPSLVALRLPGGEWLPVQRRWQEGVRVGFETVGTAPLVMRPDESELPPSRG